MRSHVPSEVLAIYRRLRVITSGYQAEGLISDLLDIKAPHIVSFLNQHGVNIAFEDADFRADMYKANTLLRDGAALALSMRALGYPSGMNMNGTDFIPRILKQAKGRKVAVFGTKDPWLAQAASKLRLQGTDIVSVIDGFQSNDIYLAAANQFAPDIILLGMGMPRQEILASKLMEAVSHPCLILNGGAILDFYGDRFPRAPVWIQRLYLEWFFRLLIEPGRMAGRYIKGGLFFAWRVMLLRQFILTSKAT